MAREPLDKGWKIHTIVGCSFFLSLLFWGIVDLGLHSDHIFSLAFITTVAVLGVYFFARGLAVYREFRVLLGTPETPIRSLAMGFVEVHGKATGGETVTGPVSKTPCFYYRVTLKGRGTTHNIKGEVVSTTYFSTDEGGKCFYLQDATGKVRVNPTGMETDLLLNKETKLALAQVNPLVGLIRALSARKPPPLSAQDELINYAKNVIQPDGSLYGCQFWEYCVLPGHWYDLAGTCMENPEPRDERDRNMIAKGSNEPTFLISWRSEKGIKARVQRRAVLDIVVGGVLIMLGAAAGLAVFGLL